MGGMHCSAVVGSAGARGADAAATRQRTAGAAGFLPTYRYGCTRILSFVTVARSARALPHLVHPNFNGPITWQNGKNRRKFGG
jgi:hypothetical protein